ncbi:MAG: hypothetical protein FWF12_05740 [Betaproteobacteria bacterium]|nr:hypothetical protein [Betaproteobacteria bacterium]
MDLVGVLINLAREAEPVIIVIQGVAGLIAIFLFTSGLVDLWMAGNANSQKFLSGNQHSSIAGAIVQLFIAILFLAVADLELLGIATRTFTNDYTAARLTSSSFSYAPNATNARRAELAIFAIVAILQVIGLIAFMKGLFVLNGRAKGTTQDSYGKGICFLVGGVGCWNIVYVAWVINNTIGFNIWGLFKI